MNKVSFGFDEVDVAEKVRRVKGVFQSVAGRYDVMNDLMSLGIHRLWKKDFLKHLALKPQATVLDVAGGTGDIARQILLNYRYLDLDVYVCDLTPEMMFVGRDRAINDGVVHGLSWICGQAEVLPMPDNCVDVYTIAFGLRNVGDIDGALAEAFRVLKPGGQFICLEFSKVQNHLLSRAYETYSFEWIPRLGQWMTGDRGAYQYLVESIRQFPAQDELCHRMAKVGFESVSYENFLNGISAIHKGYKP